MPVQNKIQGNWQGTNISQVFFHHFLSVSCNSRSFLAHQVVFDNFFVVFTWARVEPWLLGYNSSFTPLDPPDSPCNFLYLGLLKHTWQSFFIAWFALGWRRAQVAEIEF